MKRASDEMEASAARNVVAFPLKDSEMTNEEGFELKIVA